MKVNGTDTMCVSVLRWSILIVALWGVAWPAQAQAHELSQPVPVLLERMHDALLLLNRNKPEQAFTKAVSIADDFPDTSRGRLIQEVGLRDTARRLDTAYRTKLAEEVTGAIERKDVPHLQKVLYSLSFLLILEKLDRLEQLMGEADARLETRAAVLAVAHDYFSHMFERLLRFRAADQIKALDRLLDRMAVAVKRGDAGALRALRVEFLRGLFEGFQGQLVGGQLRPTLVSLNGSGS